MPKRFPYAKGISTVCIVNEGGIPRIYQFLPIRVLRHEAENISFYTIYRTRYVILFSFKNEFNNKLIKSWKYISNLMFRVF